MLGTLIFRFIDIIFSFPSKMDPSEQELLYILFRPHMYDYKFPDKQGGTLTNNQLEELMRRYNPRDLLKIFQNNKISNTLEAEIENGSVVYIPLTDEIFIFVYSPSLQDAWILLRRQYPDLFGRNTLAQEQEYEDPLIRYIDEFTNQNNRQNYSNP